MNFSFHKIRSERKLGLRIIKTGIAVTVCVVASNLLKLNQPFLAVIATVLSMGKSVDLSVRSGKNKMLGALLGCGIGCCFAMIASSNAGLCGVGIIIVLYLCQLLHLENAGSLACFAFTAVLFCPVSVKPWVYALTCAEIAVLGVAAAVVVNLIILPPNYAEVIQRTYALLREKTDLAIQDASERQPFDVKEIEVIIERLAANVRLYVSEAKLLRGDDEEVFSISCKVSSYRLILDELKAVDAMDLRPGEDVPEELLPVYRYHMERMLRLLESAAVKTVKNKKAS